MHTQKTSPLPFVLGAIVYGAMSMALFAACSLAVGLVGPVLLLAVAAALAYLNYYMCFLLACAAPYGYRDPWVWWTCIGAGVGGILCTAVAAVWVLLNV